MYIAALIVFLVAIFVYALTFTKKVNSVESMTSANSALPWYVNAGTLIVTYFGSGALIGGAALAYQTGYNAVWMYAGGWLAILFLLLMSDRIRSVGTTMNSEMIGLRFGEKTGLVASIIIVLAEMCLVAYNIRSTAVVIEVATGMNQSVGAILAVVFVVAFTVVAGLLSVAWTDYMQSIVIVVSIIIAIPFLISKGGGWGAITAQLPPEFLSPLESFDIVYALRNFLPTMCLVAMTSAYYQRFSAAKSRKELRWSVVIWLIGIVSITTLVMTYAMIASTMLETSSPDNIIMLASKELLPGVLGVLMIVTCCSILFTTADSFLLSSSTVFLNDIYLKHIKKGKDVSDKHKQFVLRSAIVIVGAAAFVLIKLFPDILSMIYFSYTMEGGLIILVLACFFWKRASIQAGFVSTILIGVTTVGWEIATRINGAPPFGMATIFATLIVGIVSLVAVTLVTPAPDPKYLERFEYPPKNKVQSRP